jgi:oligoendopeptidase F
MKDQKKAVVDYLRALALGGMNSLPELYAAAGVKFAFDAQTLRPIVDIIEQKIESLDSKE